MYIIKGIRVNDQTYLDSQIKECSYGIGTSLILLENTARLLVKERSGTEAYHQSKIIDVVDALSIVAPMVDGTYLYRLTNYPHAIHVYERTSTVITSSGWFSESLVAQSSFKRVYILELEECLLLEKHRNNVLEKSPVEFVKFGPAGIQIPKNMTVYPMCDVIAQLKSSAQFLRRKNETDPIVSDTLQNPILNKIIN